MFLKRLIFEFLHPWLSCPGRVLPLREKILYLGRLASLALQQSRKSIHYLGREFHFDNIRTPVLLLAFPKDIGVYILPHVQGPIRRVLDIGGNLGQFSLALDYCTPNVEQIDIFEPNPKIRSMLEQNVPEKMRIYPYGVGEAGLREFFTQVDGSVGGSVYRERATWKGINPEQFQVELVSSVKDVTGHSQYDLIKIDVEGAELEVLEHLDVRARYIWLELSGKNKPGVPHKTSEIYDILQRKFGSFDVLYHAEWDTDSVCEVLLEFSPEV